MLHASPMHTTPEKGLDEKQRRRAVAYYAQQAVEDYKEEEMEKRLDEKMEKLPC